MDPTTSSIYSTPPRPSSSMSQVSLPSMEKGTVKMPSNFVTYVIVKLSKLDEIQNSTTVERMKSIVYIGETSQSPQERLSEHRRAKFAHNPLDYGMVVVCPNPSQLDAMKSEFCLFKCQKYMSLIPENFAGLAETGRRSVSSIFNEEIRASIRQSDIDAHIQHLKNAFRLPLNLVDMDKKPYECTECSLSFYTKSGYEHHVLKHKGTKQQCPYCDFMCVRTDHFTRHVAIHKRHKCPKCDLHFSLRTGLEEHLKTNHKRPKIPCTWPGCNRGYTTQQMLNQHRQSAHMGQKFRCDHENCADHPGYNSRAKLAEHKRKHTGMLQLVKCERCCLSFSDRATMRVHMKKEHEDYDLE